MKTSHSAMQCFRDCPRKYYLSRVECIKPTRYSRPLSFGSAIHKALEALHKGLRLTEVLHAWLEACTEYSLDPDDKVYGEVLIVAYAARYEDKLKKKPVAVESEFLVPILGPDGNPELDMELHGFIDVEWPKYIEDHKTTSKNITPTYLKELEREPQAEEYLIAAQDSGSKATYAVWDVIRSNKQARRLKTPTAEQEFYKRNGKHGSKGDPKPGTYLQDESWAEFRARLVGDISDHPSKYFTQVKIRKTEEELLSRRYDIWATAKMIQFCTETDAFPRNQRSCSDFGGCEYQGICWDGVDPEQSELFVINKERGR